MIRVKGCLLLLLLLSHFSRVRPCATPETAAYQAPLSTELCRQEYWSVRCAGKAGNPFQTTQGNRLSCRDQEGRRGSEEAVPGPSVVPSGDPGVSGDFWGSQEGCQGPSRPSGRNRGLPLRRRGGQGEGMMLKLKLHYFGHLMRRVDSLEKTLMLGGIGGKAKRGCNSLFQHLGLALLFFVFITTLLYLWTLVAGPNH